MTNIAYTKKIYDKFAKEYHAKRNNIKESLWNRYLEAPVMTKLVKPLVKNKHVLDLGCGSGIFTGNLKSWDADVIGCDISKNLISIAKKENPKIKFIVCNAERTPFKNSEFYVVTSGLMLHYMKDLNPAIKEVSRILHKDGIFVFSMNHPLGESYQKKKVGTETLLVLKPYFNNDKCEWTMSIEGMNMVTYHHTFEDIFDTLSDCGFVVERLIETQPTKEFKRYDAKAYDRTSKYPSFIVIKARKV